LVALLEAAIFRIAIFRADEGLAAEAELRARAQAEAFVDDLLTADIVEIVQEEGAVASARIAADGLGDIFAFGYVPGSRAAPFSLGIAAGSSVCYT
jgi:hypothetical protein